MPRPGSVVSLSKFKPEIVLIERECACEEHPQAISTSGHILKDENWSGLERITAARLMQKLPVTVLWQLFNRFPWRPRNELAHSHEQRVTTPMVRKTRIVHDEHLFPCCGLQHEDVNVCG